MQNTLREFRGRVAIGKRDVKLPLACVASVSVRFRSKERGTSQRPREKAFPCGLGAKNEERVKDRARPKPRIPFLGLSLLRNQTETLATQAKLPWMQNFWCQQPLTEKAICIVVQWKKSMGYRFVLESIMHRTMVHVNFFFFFFLFLPYLQDHSLLRSGNFTTMPSHDAIKNSNERIINPTEFLLSRNIRAAKN